MAVAPTGAIYKALEFDGVSSRTYGVYITGEAVYNAPERDVEMITIPGRSGSFALDNGRFENITVTYPAGIFAETEADFREAISDFRNFLCSRKGYVRLQDEYNPNEYRMAVYKSGLEVEPAMLKAGEFDIVFDCKPQRWLTSGETAIEVTSGDEISNPTLFEASPLLEVEGYGDITLNDDVITIENAPLGDVTVYDGYTSTPTVVTHLYFDIDVSRLNTGDAITLSGVQVNTNKEIYASLPNDTYQTVDVNTSSGIASSSTGITGTRTAYINYIPDAVVFNYGTAATSPTSSLQSREVLKETGGTQTVLVTHEYYAVYDGDNRIDIYVSSNNPTNTRNVSRKCIIPELKGFSTLSVLPTPIYIDLDIGEAYGDYSGVIASVNNIVQLPAELPTLPSGTSEITFDNTITDLKVTPRWWKV